MQPDHAANNLGLQDPSCLIKARVPKRKPNPFTRHTQCWVGGGCMDGWVGVWMVSTPGYCKQEAQHDIMASYP